MLIVGAAPAALAALAIYWRLSRRLRRLAEAVEAGARDGCRQPLRVPGADAHGDEIQRLSAHVERMSGRIGEQVAELERSVDRRRELLANVSHDLRTPLTLMQGYLETMLLRRGELTPAEERSCLEVAARHAERLGRLVADLFELTKLDGQAGRIQAEPFSLTELAQDIAQKFTLHAGAQQVRVDLDLDARTQAVVGDIGMIERALENLVENALRHTPVGGHVTIEVASGPARAQVCVRDTGCGISRENLPHVFDRYFQAPRVELMAGGDSADNAMVAATARHHAGLGLAITRRIVALHGGDIQVCSTPGVGTAFSFDLPLAAPSAAPNAAATTRESPCTSVSSSSCRLS